MLSCGAGQEQADSLDIEEVRLSAYLGSIIVLLLLLWLMWQWKVDSAEQPNGDPSSLTDGGFSGGGGSNSDQLTTDCFPCRQTLHPPIFEYLCLIGNPLSSVDGCNMVNLVIDTNYPVIYTNNLVIDTNYLVIYTNYPVIYKQFSY